MIFSDPNMLLVFKVIILVATFLYGIFSFVTFKQTKLMSITFGTPFGGFFRLLALVHLVALILIFILSLIIL